MKRVFQTLVYIISISLSLSTTVRAADVTVSAAISLKEAFTKIATRFEQDHPGDKIIFNFGSSGELAQQIQQGAPVDVFASAAFKQINILDKQDLLIKESIQPFTRNELVVIVSQGQQKLTAFPDFIKLNKVALGNPKTVPVGQYAAEALTKAGVYQTLVDQNKLVYGENVRQVLTYVESGNVDAGIVYKTDALTSTQVTISFAIPASYSEPIIYPIAIVKDSKHIQLAQDFVNDVIGNSGQKVLQEQGFLSVK